MPLLVARDGYPEDIARLRGICKNLVANMRQSWKEKRQKELKVPEALIEHIAKLSHEKNEKSQGKEGGRIVRKLLADMIEANIQRAIADRTQEYIDCKTVAVLFLPPSEDDDSATGQIQIEFLGAGE